uniref:Uncharacterized protein n=1 Tax=Rhipicephalus zambeziensis TaxID=60191 RepID=A0A224YAZ0_9ACAR
MSRDCKSTILDAVAQKERATDLNPASYNDTAGGLVGRQSTRKEAQVRERLIFACNDCRRGVRTPQAMQPARRRTSRRAANRRTQATAPDNRDGRHGPIRAPPHAAMLLNERGILPPSHLLPSQPGNIMVHRVYVTEGMNCQRPAPNRRGVLQLYGRLPQSGQTMVFTSAFTGQGASSAGTGGGTQHQFDFLVQPPSAGLPQPVNAAALPPPNMVLLLPPNATLLQAPDPILPQPASVTLLQQPKAVPLQPSNTVSLQSPSAMARRSTVPEVSDMDIALEYVDEKLKEELHNRLVSFGRPNTTRKEKLADYNRILLIQKILAI